MAPHTAVKVIEIPKNSGKWYVRINYKRRRKTKLFESRERAEAVAERLSTALRLYGLDAFKMLSEAEARPTPTLRAFAERWLQELDKGDLKLSTRKMYASNLKIHILPALGGRLVSDIDYPAIKAFLLGKRLATYSTGRFRSKSRKHKYATAAEDHPYSRDTVRIMVMTLRAILNEAARENLIQENPIHGMASFYRKKSKDRIVTRNDVYTLEDLYAIEDQLKNRTLYGDDYEMALAISRTGMRIGEVAGLQWDDLDWKENKIHVWRNIPSGTGQAEDTTKTPAGARTIDMSSDLVAALKALQARRREERLKTGRPGPRAIFPAGYKDFYISWRRAQAQLGLRYRSPHSIRHTYASQMLAAGCDIAWLSRQLGHSSPAVTLAIYSHFIPGRNTQNANALDRTNANEMQIRSKTQDIEDQKKAGSSKE